MTMPTANIEWRAVKATTHRVEIRSTPKGGNTYYVVTDAAGNKFVPCWGSRDAKAAQTHLNNMANLSRRRK
jgi:hypothetical protein